MQHRYKGITGPNTRRHTGKHYYQRMPIGCLHPYLNTKQSEAAYEKPAHPPTIRFYLEYGNHGALVYAVSLKLQTEAYQPVRAIFSPDWSHLYPWGQVTA